MLKKLIYKCMLLLVIIVSTFTLLFLTITVALPPQFTNSYQYVINDKYENLVNMKSPKIIFIAGSSGAFGINTKLIKEGTGLECANLALHAGFGMKFQTEIAKGNISKGDLVIISYENANWSKNTESAELIVTAIDNNINMYRYVPRESYGDIVKYLPTYFFKKLDSAFITPIQFNGIYSRSSFDSYGNMIFNRPNCILANPLPDKNEDRIKINKSIISDEMIKYVNEFNEYVRSKGATLVVSFSPTLNEAVLSNKNEVVEFQTYLAEKLNVPIISNVNDYIFDRSYFYDTIYHLNSYGEVERTKLLVRDINKFLNKNK